MEKKTVDIKYVSMRYINGHLLIRWSFIKEDLQNIIINMNIYNEKYVIINNIYMYILKSDLFLTYY